MKKPSVRHLSCLGVIVACCVSSHAQLRVSGVNPRYLVQGSDTTRAVFLAGTQTWLTLRDGGEAPTIPQVPPFNWQGYLDFLTQQGHNHTKFRTWENDWNNALSNLSDFRYGPCNIYRRTGPGIAEDGFPKFNLDSLDQGYFDRVRMRTDTLAGRGIYVEIQLFDGWAVSTKGLSGTRNPFQGHPYNMNNNVQGTGFPDSAGDNTHVLPGQGGSNVILACQVAYVKKMIDELNDRDNVLWEICNEPNANAQDWEYAIVDTIKNYEMRKPKQHPIVMSVEFPDQGGTNEETLDPTRHNDGSANSKDYSRQVNNDTAKVILTDTDHICGECMDGAWVYKSFCNGVGGIAFMDPWDGRHYPHLTQNYDSSAPNWVSARKAMGQIQRIANGLNVIDMRPSPGMASTGYCLSGNRKWVVYQPASGGFTVDLSGGQDTINVRWLNTGSGDIIQGSPMIGGSVRSFTPPFAGDAVVYLYAKRQVRASVKVFLEGAYDSLSGLMTTDLHLQGILPAHFGGRIIPALAVDSVTIELRSSASASGSSVREFAPAWLLADGTIRGFTDTTRNYVEYDAAPGSYYLVVWHRNHLPVMTSSPQDLRPALGGLTDFTISQEQAYGTNPMRRIGSTCVMRGGDADGNFGIGAIDLVHVTAELGATEYASDDLDLNGVVNTTDLSLCRQNLGFISQVPP